MPAVAMPECLENQKPDLASLINLHSSLVMLSEGSRNLKKRVKTKHNLKEPKP
jgi:hypothetical protein